MKNTRAKRSETRGRRADVLRVIQVGSGSVGGHSLRAILGRPDLELVGLLVFSDAKVGRDAGEIASVASTGVIATNDIDDVLSLSADVVVYNALGETIGPEHALETICAFLESGKNVCSTAVSTHIYPAMTPDVEARLEAACQAGGASFHSSGINPGFTFDYWPLALMRMSGRVDRVSVTEVADMVDYDSPQIMEFMGFGLSPDETPALHLAHQDTSRSAYRASLLMLADALGREIHDIRFEREVAVTPVPIELAAGKIDAGTVAAVRLCFAAECAPEQHGVPAITLNVIWRVSDDIAPEWPKGDGLWLMRIDGDPVIESELRATAHSGSGRAVSITTAMVAVNAIRAVCAAPVGIQTHLDLPLTGGGSLTSVR